MNYTTIFRKCAIILAIFSFAMFSCVGDLDTEPIDPNATTASKVFNDEQNYINALSKLYAGFAVSGQQGPSGNADIKFLDEGHGQYLRGLFVLQEQPTETCINGWSDGNLPKISQCTWAANNEFIRAFYYRAIYQVTIANEFLRNLPAELPNLDAAQFRAEARYIRAFAYWQALDLFGNGVPFVTEANEVGAFLPQPAGEPGYGSDRRELYDFIESELLAIENDLPERGSAEEAELGRADRGAVWMLLAKLYLGASVYIETNELAKAETYLDKLLNSASYTLEDDYKLMFSANNNESTETIWSINFNALSTQTWGGMTYIIHAGVGGSMSADEFGINGGWGGNRALRELYGLFDDPADIRGPGELIQEGDDGGDITEQSQFTQGYFVFKFKNVNSDGSDIADPDPNGDHVDTDFAVFRLSDAVLMKAEVEIGGAGGSGTVSGNTLSLLNEIRTRAGASTVNAGDVDSDWILDERARELYWECHRRSDLIRFGKFTGGNYLWQFKGGAIDGSSIDSRYRIMPIPTSDLNANPNLKQNPGY